MSCNVDKIAFIFNIFSGILFQFEACIAYCFHAWFIFDFVLDVLIVVFTPKIY